MSLLKQSAGSLQKLIREKTESGFQPPTDAELETHHGPFLKVMHDILFLVDQKELNTNTLEMYQGMKRILRMAKGTGVLPDGATETFSERCAKGVSHTAYAKAEYWVENKYVRLYSILKPKFSDIHYYIFFPTLREVEEGNTNWKAKWIFTNQDKKNEDPKITHRQGMLCTFFLLDGDSFTLDHVKKFRHEYDTREAMNDIYQYYRKFFIKENLSDDIGCLFNSYSKHKLQAFEDSMEIENFLAKKKAALKEEGRDEVPLTSTPSGGLKLSLSSLKGVIKSSPMSPRLLGSDSQKSPRGPPPNSNSRQEDGAILGSPYSSNQRLKSDVISSNHNILTNSGHSHSKPLPPSNPIQRQQRDESLLLNPLPLHNSAPRSPRPDCNLNTNSRNEMGNSPFVVSSNMTINLNLDGQDAPSHLISRSPNVPISPRNNNMSPLRDPTGTASNSLNIRQANSPHSPPVSPRYNVSSPLQPTQTLNSNGFNSNSNRPTNSPPRSPQGQSLRDSPDSKRTLGDSPSSPRSRPNITRNFTQGVSPMEDLVIPTLEGNIVLKNITGEEDQLSPRKKDLVLSASRGKK